MVQSELDWKLPPNRHFVFFLLGSKWSLGGRSTTVLGRVGRVIGGLQIVRRNTLGNPQENFERTPYDHSRQLNLENKKWRIFLITVYNIASRFNRMCHEKSLSGQNIGKIVVVGTFSSSVYRCFSTDLFLQAFSQFLCSIPCCFRIFAFPEVSNHCQF